MNHLEKLLIFVFACFAGHAGATSVADDNPHEWLFEDLRAEVLRVNMNIENPVEYEWEEKRTSKFVCKSEIGIGVDGIPSINEYTCYKLLVKSNDEAKLVYDSYLDLVSAERSIQKFGLITAPGSEARWLPVIGNSTSEVSEGNVFCRRSGAVVPNPAYSYSCYEKISF